MQRYQQNIYRDQMIQNKFNNSSLLIQSRNSFLYENSPLRSYSPHTKMGVVCMSCSSKKELRNAMLRAFKKKYGFINEIKKSIDMSAIKSKIKDGNESDDSFRSINFDKRNKQNFQISYMGKQYRYKSKMEQYQPILNSQQQLQEQNVISNASFEIAQKPAQLLPEINQRFIREFNDYDIAIRDIKNAGRYNGKKLKAAQAESMIIRKKNHEFFQELNTIALGQIKIKYEPSRSLMKNYKNKVTEK
eukprot:403357580